MRHLSLILGLTAVLSLGHAGPASASIDAIVQVNKGQTYTWEGEKTVGANLNYWSENIVGETPVTPVGTCNKDRFSYCQAFLFKVHNPIGQEEADQGIAQKTATVTIDIAAPATPTDPVQPPDFDLYAYESSDLGQRGDLLGKSNTAQSLESVAFPVRTTLSQPSAWILVHVVYCLVPYLDGYSGRFKVS